MVFVLLAVVVLERIAFIAIYLDYKRNYRRNSDEDPNFFPDDVELIDTVVRKETAILEEKFYHNQGVWFKQDDEEANLSTDKNHMH